VTGLHTIYTVHVTGIRDEIVELKKKKKHGVQAHNALHDWVIGGYISSVASSFSRFSSLVVVSRIQAALGQVRRGIGNDL
jgi:hypothetical protein